ncbi:hypothetical protein HDU76_008802, partial [Blyttiomyces sp. JEL0837]
LETAAAVIMDQKMMVSEKDSLIQSLQNRIMTMAEQLRTADFRIHELTTTIQTNNISPMTATTSLLPSPANFHFPSTTNSDIHGSSATNSNSNSATNMSFRNHYNGSESFADEVKVLKDSQAHMKKRLKKVSARCVELEHELEITKAELSLYKETNERLEPMLRSRPSEASLSTTARIQAIHTGGVASNAFSEVDKTGATSDLMIALVKELTFENKKLDTALQETKELLETAQAEVTSLSIQLQEKSDKIASASLPQDFPDINKKTIFGELEEYVLSRSLQKLGLGNEDDHLARSSDAPEHLIRRRVTPLEDSPLRNRLDEEVSHGVGKDDVTSDGVSLTSQEDSSEATGLMVTTTTSPRSPLQKSVDGGDRKRAPMPSPTYTPAPPKMVRSDSNASSIFSNGSAAAATSGVGALPSSTQIYIRTLSSMAVALHGRLNATDTVSLNKRLRREFDLAELTRLSQRVIANISSDIENLSSRFPSASEPLHHRPATYFNKGLGVHGHGQSSIHQSPAEDMLLIVHPMVSIIQTLLKDIAFLRSTLNDLSLAYFERVIQRSQ